MAKIAFYTARIVTGIPQASTRLIGLADGQVFFGPSAAGNAQRTVRPAGVSSNLYVRITANTIAASSTLTFQKGGVNQTQTITIGSTATGEFEDTTHSDTLAAADLIQLQLVTGAS